MARKASTGRTPKKRTTAKVKRKAPAKAKPKSKAKRATKPRDNGKHPGGRPPLYDSPDRFKARADEYFVFCDNMLKTFVGKEGEPTTQVCPEPYTMARWAHWMGFADRDGYLEYEKRPEFSGVVKNARLRIEADVELRLLEGRNPTGPIFWLKNHAGYKDRMDVTSGDEKIPGVSDAVFIAQVADRMRRCK